MGNLQRESNNLLTTNKSPSPKARPKTEKVFTLYFAYAWSLRDLEVNISLFSQHARTTLPTNYLNTRSTRPFNARKRAK